MANIVITRPHALGMEQAKSAVQRVAEALQSDLQARHRWQGDRLDFECPGANGHIQLSEREICVNVSLSWLLTPAKGRIERSIQEYLDRSLRETV